MDILNHENFDTFDDSYYDDTIVNENLSLTARQNIRKVKTVCLDYIKHFDDSYDNLIFYGSTGVGKTFLTHCIAKKLLDTSHTVLYLTSLQLFDILERNKFRHEDISTSNEQIAYMLQSDLLIIDDLGQNWSMALRLLSCIILLRSAISTVSQPSSRPIYRFRNYVTDTASVFSHVLSVFIISS